MLEKIRVDMLDYTDLIMYKCGIEDCTPNHSWGPGVRDHYLIHFINSGKGVFQNGSTEYYLEKGDGFLICPNTINHYRADSENPWSYSWVGFNGIKASEYLRQAGLSSDNPIFHYTADNYIKDCFSQMIAAKALEKSKEMHLLGLLYLLLSKLIESTSKSEQIFEKKQDRKELYIGKVVEYIRMNYSRKISISEISSHIGLDRSYLCSIFKTCLNTPPQEYLISFRISKACELMQNHLLSIGDISRSVGYDDPLLFSKTFKKLKGVSPREYRKIHLISKTINS